MSSVIPENTINGGMGTMVSYYVAHYPGRTLAMLAALLLAGLLEGVGMAALLPLIEAFNVPGAAESAISPLLFYIRRTMSLLGMGDGIGSIMLLIGIAITAKSIFLLLAMNQAGYTVSRIATDLRLRVIRSVLDAEWSYFVNHKVGTFANSISTEAVRASQAYYAACLLAADGIQVFAYLSLTLLVSWRVSLAVLVGSPIIFLLFAQFVRRAKQAGDEQTHYQRQIMNRLTDGLQGIKPIKAMAREESLAPILEQDAEVLNGALKRQIFNSQVLNTQQEPVVVLTMMGVLWLSLNYTSVPFSELTILALLFYRMASRVGLLQKRYQSIRINQSAYWSLIELVESARKTHLAGDGRIIAPELSKSIRLDDISFAYPNHPILDQVSMTIPAHSIVAFTGPSGVGKTTVADLIVGLLRPDAGRIWIDDMTLDDFDLISWRRRVGYVPQEMTLFHDTLHNNVTLGDPRFSDEDVAAALGAAGLGELASRFPLGLDTIIGERGSKLSGGQRQRVALARALIHRPTLLVLDEMTTSLDPRTEAEICITLQRLSQELTILAISHQPALVDIADTVFELHGGKLLTVKQPVTACIQP